MSVIFHLIYPYDIPVSLGGCYSHLTRENCGDSIEHSIIACQNVLAKRNVNKAPLLNWVINLGLVGLNNTDFWEGTPGFLFQT